MEGKVTLIHFSADGPPEVVMTSFDDVDDALNAAGDIDDTRLVYLSQPDANLPNGIRVSKVTRSEAGSANHVEPSGPQMTSLHNAIAEKPVARFATATKALEKTTQVLSERLAGDGKVEEQEGEKVTTTQEASVPVTSATSRGGRKQAHTDDMIVRLKVDKNPKKAGSGSHARFEAMMKAVKAGKNTVKQVIEAGATRGDLAYDENHGFISVFGSSTSA